MNVTSKNMNQSYFEDDIILIVDDNSTNLGVLSDYLLDQGFTTRVASDGELALQRAERIQPALILLDVMMPPGIDGFETCRRLKAKENTKDIPVIFMTALLNTEDKVKGFSVGAVDYITKPIQHEEVLARVITHLRLQKQNKEIMMLNERLKSENLRLGAELDIARQLQQMVLPNESELNQIDELDIAGFMESAEEVGGDYYDVLKHNGHLKIGIGDVTGHGLESGVLMLMVQTAVRSLLISEISDPEIFLNRLNRTIYDNVQRIHTDKNLTLSLLDYHNGHLHLTGQHEEVLLVRQGGNIERIDTIDLGLSVGLKADIANFVKHQKIKLQAGDGIVLYTGITEALNFAGNQYGIEQLCHVVSHNWDQSAKEVQHAIISDVHQYIGAQKLHDDMTLLVLKQK